MKVMLIPLAIAAMFLRTGMPLVYPKNYTEKARPYRCANDNAQSLSSTLFSEPARYYFPTCGRLGGALDRQSTRTQCTREWKTAIGGPPNLAAGRWKCTLMNISC